MRQHGSLGGAGRAFDICELNDICGIGGGVITGGELEIQDVFRGDGARNGGLFGWVGVGVACEGVVGFKVDACLAVDAVSDEHDPAEIGELRVG